MRGGLPFEKDVDAPIFKGLVRKFLFLLGCSAPTGPQLELLWYLLGYCYNVLALVSLRDEKIQTTPTKQDLATC